jgi:hypothetical protein
MNIIIIYTAIILIALVTAKFIFLCILKRLPTMDDDFITFCIITSSLGLSILFSVAKFYGPGRPPINQVQPFFGPTLGYLGHPLGYHGLTWATLGNLGLSWASLVNNGLPCMSLCILGHPWITFGQTDNWETTLRLWVNHSGTKVKQS